MLSFGPDIRRAEIPDAADTPAQFAGQKIRIVDNPQTAALVTALGARLHADGTDPETQSPNYPDQGTLTGHYVVKGDEVTFFWNPSHRGPRPRKKVRWSYVDGQLTFAIVDVADAGGRVLYTAHPWRKIS